MFYGSVFGNLRATSTRLYWSRIAMCWLEMGDWRRSLTTNGVDGRIVDRVLAGLERALRAGLPIINSEGTKQIHLTTVLSD